MEPANQVRVQFADWQTDPALAGGVAGLVTVTDGVGNTATVTPMPTAYRVVVKNGQNTSSFDVFR